MQPPILELTAIGDDAFVLVDTRGLADTSTISFLNRTQAQLALTGDASAKATDIELALANGWIVEVDQVWQPLVIAEPCLLESFESALGTRRARGQIPSLPMLFG